MGLVTVGISHKTAPVALRERLSIPATELGNVLQRSDQDEAMCKKRWCSPPATVWKFTRARRRTARRPCTVCATFFQNVYGGLELNESLYHREAEGAVAHLFRVAAGLDSLVVGETEILGQVKSAYLFSQSQGATGKITNVLFQRALFVGKHIRTKTRLSEGSSSVGSVAVQLAEKIFGSLQERRVIAAGRRRNGGSDRASFDESEDRLAGHSQPHAGKSAGAGDSTGRRSRLARAVAGGITGGRYRHMFCVVGKTADHAPRARSVHESPHGPFSLSRRYRRAAQRGPVRARARQRLRL